jgi:murein DD-endopeptidase MepM/ murein hydrolase activator NlpD
MREAWLGRQFGKAAVAAPTGFAPFVPTRPAGFSLAVDLGDDLFSRRWWRGLATLGALCTAAALTAPDFGPLPAGHPASLTGQARDQWTAVGIDSLSRGSTSGIRMAPGARVEPIDAAPERVAIDVFATLGRDGVARSLARIGAASGDAMMAASLIHGAAPRLKPGTSLSVRLGRRDAGGRRSIERIALRASMALKLLVERNEAGSLELGRIAVPVSTTPIRVRGRASDGLYWALRTAGASPATATSYLKALAQEIDVGEIGPDASFDLVIDRRRSADGEVAEGDLLYAGLDRLVDRDLQLVRWTAGGRPVWVDAATVGQMRAPSEGMIWPVAARITSGFGPRIHPILRFARMHRGIDFGARRGTPIHAAADGQVTRAGWAGGYGRQVRLAHGGGMASSYSHMSSLAVAPGALVRQGQLIGFVGSSGLSTGPHLHYEVYRGGVAVNPMNARFTAAQRAADPGAVAAIKARLKALLNVGVKKA